jgi:hypothetical protein
MLSVKRVAVFVAGLTAAVVVVRMLSSGNGSAPPSTGPPQVEAGSLEVSLPANTAEQTAARVAPTPTEEPVVLLDADGFDRSETGARDAAVGYLESTELAVEMSPADAAELARSMASDRYRDEFAVETEQSMVELWETIPDGITLRLSPLEARATAVGDDWIVSVWFVEVISIGTDAVVDDWRTVTYRMVWQDGTWKIDSFESERGPTPGRGTQPASSTPAGFEALLDGFSDEGLA